MQVTERRALCRRRDIGRWVRGAYWRQACRGPRRNSAGL